MKECKENIQGGFFRLKKLRLFYFDYVGNKKNWTELNIKVIRKKKKSKIVPQYSNNEKSQIINYYDML